MGNAPKTLKVGLVVDDGLDSTDGVQQYVLGLGAWLEQQGHEVHYLAGQTVRRDIPHLHSLSRNIKVRFNGNSLSMPLPSNRRQIRQLLARERFDVLHVQTPHSPFMAQHVVLAADPGTAIIGTFHILPYTKLSAIGNKALGIWLRPSLRRFDEIVSVSAAAAAFAKASFGIETPVVPNMVDCALFRKARPLPQYDDDRLTILFLGRLVPRKGCLLLMEAIHKLQSRPNLPKFQVLICGRGPLESKLRQFIARHGLGKTVSLEGFVSEADKPRYYASADLAVFPSYGGESFGIVLVEAMASGRPLVLAADNPGYRSVLTPQPELLFETTDAQILADKLAYYLTHETERRRLQAWQKEYVERFDVNRVGQEIVEVYRRALHKKRGA
jgi:phosphatidylinositol alpha-mannosyltransferase